MRRFDLSNVAVGDRVVVLPDRNRLGGGSFVVTKVGPKYVTTGQYGRDRKFSRLTGQERGNGVGGYCYALTESQHTEHLERVRDVGLLRNRVLASSQWYEALTADQARRILAILMEGGAT